jgi:hypothetical protein
MMVMMTVPTIPTAHPALEKANGIARIPDPNDALIRFASDRMSLKNVNINERFAIFMNNKAQFPLKSSGRKRK